MKYLICSLLVGLIAAAPTQSKTEDPRETFARGFLLQVHSWALHNDKASTDEIYSRYKDQFVAKTKDEPSQAWSEREGHFKDLIRSLAELARAGATSDDIFHGKGTFEVKKAPTVEKTPDDQVIWQYDIPAKVNPDRPEVRAVKWTLHLRQPTKGSDWKIFGLDKDLLPK